MPAPFGDTESIRKDQFLSSRHARPQCLAAPRAVLASRGYRLRTHLLFTMSDRSGRRLECQRQAFVSSSTRSGRKPAAAPGGARRDRTDDLMLAKHALSQLSYGPVPGVSRRTASREGMVGPGRLERPTSRLSGVRSNHLSYGPMSRQNAGQPERG
jgi:hypothetical protein